METLQLAQDVIDHPEDHQEVITLLKELFNKDDEGALKLIQEYMVDNKEVVKE